jgi:hypothetical protein
MVANGQLARLLAKQESRDQSRATLAGIYRCLTGGFDTRDLKDAKAPLEKPDA